MTDFTLLSKAVHAKFNEISQGELYLSHLNGDALWDAYLAAFPEGSNPIFRERTEHDCSCCRNFIKNIGGVIAIEGGRIVSVWSGIAHELPYPYSFVADALADLIESHPMPIASLYRTERHLASFGAEHTFEQVEGGDPIKWNHFYGKVNARHQSDNAALSIGEYSTSVQMFKRAMDELKPAAFETVLDLINSDNLYKGPEFKKAVETFLALAVEHQGLGSRQEREIHLWKSAANTAVRIRNTAIGTLLIDLSEGVPLDKAVASFENKVSGTNYKRPKALITPAMIKAATDTIEALGIETALQRRHAKISDITINNVLWADRQAAQHMKGALTDLLMEEVKAPVIDAGKAQDIGIAEFMADIVPTATGIDALVKGNQQGRLMSLTAPADPDAALLFKWDNGFAWSYSGNIADSDLRRAVQEKGGRVDGVLRFSHTWNYGKRNASLMDLHVFMPGCEHRSVTGEHYGTGGQRVGWNNRNDHKSGGHQDVDYTPAAPEGYVPVENITFPDISRLKDGDYQCKIHNWSLRQPTQGGFRAEIEFQGQVFQYEYDKPLGNKEWVDVATVTLKKGVFSIQHHLPCGHVPTEVWGIKTDTLVPVETILFSPNFWDEQTLGNQHFFFILKGCKNPEPVRGFYNEYLKPELDQHRKVFETLGGKLMCPVVDEQLSGVGFSTTQRDTLLVQVTGAKSKRLYNVQF